MADESNTDAEFSALVEKYRQAVKEGTGLPPPRSPIEARQEKLRGMPLSQENVEGVARAVIPFGVQAAVDLTPMGRVARMAPAVVKAAPYAKDVVGGLMGYGANVAAGLEEPSVREAVKAGALPPAARGAATTAKAVVTRLPGTPVIKQELSVGKLQKAPPIYIPLGAKDSDELFEEVAKKGNPLIPAKEIESEVDAVIKDVSAITIPALARKRADALEIALGFKNRIGELKPYGGVPFQEYWTNLKALSSHLDDLQSGGGAGFRDVTRIKAAGQRDLAAASNLPGAGYAELKIANKEYRRKLAQKELTTAVEQQGFSHKQTPQGEFVEVTPARMLNWMKHPDRKFWRESLEPDELKGVESFLNTLSKTPRIGSGDWMGAAGLAGMAGVLAYRETNDPLMAGMASTTAIALPSLISRAVLSPTGRWLLTGMIQDVGHRIPTRLMPMFAAALRAHLDRDPVDAIQRESQTRMPVETGIPGITPLRSSRVILPTAEQEALQPPSLEPSDLGNAGKLGLGLGKAGLAGLSAGVVAVGGVLASQSRNALHRQRVLEKWLKENPSATQANKDAAHRMLQEAKTDHQRALEARRAYGPGH